MLNADWDISKSINHCPIYPFITIGIKIMLVNVRQVIGHSTYHTIVLDVAHMYIILIDTIVEWVALCYSHSACNLETVSKLSHFSLRGVNCFLVTHSDFVMVVRAWSSSTIEGLTVEVAQLQRWTWSSLQSSRSNGADIVVMSQ